MPLLPAGEAGEGERTTLTQLSEQAHAAAYVHSLSRRDRRKLERSLRVSKGATRGGYARARTIKRAGE